MPSSSSSSSSATRWKRILLLGAALALAATVACTFHGTPTQSGVLREVERARLTRVFTPQLSILLRYRSCAVLPLKAGETVPHDSCGAANERPEELDVLDEVDESTSPDSLQASALLALVAGDSSEPTLDKAIARLSRALLLSPRRVPLLVDLSGAHLVRAQRTQHARDLVAGLNYAREALAAEPRNAAARFNAALALDALAVDEQAALAWNAYLRIDSTSLLADEARRRRSAPRHPPELPAPESGASAAEVQAFAEHYPQEARLLGWDTVLGRWGDTLEAGDTAEAAKLLQLAERLGSHLERRRGGDASLADAVRAIHAAAGDPAATHVLARAHRAYAGGQVLYLGDTAARDSFQRVISTRPRSPVLVRSAELFSAARLVYDEQYTLADSAFRAVLLQIDSVRYPALAARGRWMRATGLNRSHHHIEARPLYEAAARLFGSAGETEYAGTALEMAGEALYVQRDTIAAYDLIHRGMLMLRGHRSSPWLHNALLVLANCAAIDGMPRAASIVQDEDFAIAVRLKSFFGVEALVGRARVHSARRQWKEVAQDLGQAQSLLETIPEGQREFFTAAVRSSRALLTTDSSSSADMDSAVAFFAKDKNPVWFLPVLLQRADARIARGEALAATADLDIATARIRSLSDSLNRAYLRVAVMEQARSRFDQLVMLYVHKDQAGAALQALERGRVSFAPWASRGGSAAPSRPVAPPGQVAVEYALIGDTLLTWTVRGSDVQLLQDTVDRGALVWTIERVRAALESPAHAESARPDLQHLYELLIRPVERRLGATETPLVILADGEVAAVPFDALLDSRRNRYLVEDHSLRFAATLADAARPAPRIDGPARSALLVADPAFDQEEYPTFDRLRGARAEVESLRAIYPVHVELDGSFATPGAFVARAPGASVIHYAGHAVFDDARPERSALLLTGADTTGRLTAEAVNALQLGGVRLVVLSSCSTVRSREGRSGGFAGFSGALLAAGAGGVVGSLWQADDSLTQPLMLEFHRTYRQSGDAAAALRHAQIWMLRHSPDPTLRSPAAWAGFRYMGS